MSARARECVVAGVGKWWDPQPCWSHGRQLPAGLPPSRIISDEKARLRIAVGWDCGSGEGGERGRGGGGREKTPVGREHSKEQFRGVSIIDGPRRFLHLFRVSLAPFYFLGATCS